LRLEAFEKFPAALQVRSRQLVMWPDKIPGQVVVFNSHATSFVDAGDWLTTVTPASVSIHTLAPQLSGLSGL